MTLNEVFNKTNLQIINKWIYYFGPRAGKDTQSNFIVEKPNFSTFYRWLLRKEIKNNSKLGVEISSIINSGNLVSNNIVSDLIEKYISDKMYKINLFLTDIKKFRSSEKFEYFIK